MRAFCGFSVRECSIWPTSIEFLGNGCADNPEVSLRGCYLLKDKRLIVLPRVNPEGDPKVTLTDYS